MAKVIGYGLQIVGFFTGQPGLVMAGKAILVADAYDQQRKQRNRARDQYNASLQDRMEMVDITADAPRTLVLGRVRAVEGVRRRWVSGTNSEKLTMIVSFAGHEIDAFEGWYFNDVEVAVDGNGWVTTAPFYKSTLTSRQHVFTASASAQTITLAAAPVAGSITATWAATEGGEGGSAAVGTIGGNNVDLTGLIPGVVVYVSYQSADGTSTARIRSWRGAPFQNVGAALAAEYPGKISSADAFAGMAVAAVDILYDPDVYPQGRPNITARMRGAKLYDPRLDSTTSGGSGSHRVDDPYTWAWSETPALCALHYARWSSGYALPTAEINITDVAAAAAVCDVSTAFTLRKADTTTSTVTLPRYRCGIVISSAADPRSSMADILETMAGRSGWAGGVWRLRAGARAAPSFSLDPSWLARRLNGNGQADGASVLRMSNGVQRDEKINRISGSCIDPDQRWQVLPFPAVQDAVLIAAEGEYASEVQYQGVNHIAHAQHLASVAIRENQASLRIEAACNLYAYRCELFDVGTLLLPRYGMTPELAKTAEVVGWRWHPTEGIVLQMAEISDAIYAPVAELVGRDPAPNSDLPLPGEVEQLIIGAITSGTVPLTDGSVLTRTQINWGAAVSQSIRSGGQIEVQYIEASATLPAADWPSWIEGGGSTSATIPGLRGGLWYVFRIRAVKPMLGIRGPWSTQGSQLIAQPPVGTAWDDIFGAGKPASYATVGKSLGLPFTSWALNGQSIVTIPDGKVGNTALRLIGADSSHPDQGNYVPIDRTKKYRARFWARPMASTAGGLYFSLQQFTDNAGATGPVNGGRSPYKPGGQNRAGHNTQFGGTDQWGEYSYIWDSADWQVGVQFVRPGFLDNFSGAAGHWDVQDFSFEEVTEVVNAQAAAAAAAGAAAAAQGAADAANAAIASISSDSVLSKGEKGQVVLDWTAIDGELSGIDAQATAYGITTEKTAYDAAVSALSSYLSGLSPAYTDTASDTAIVGATFRGKFADVYSTRQTLLNKIAAFAGTVATWAGVSGTGRPADNATKNVVSTGTFASRPTGADGDFYGTTDTLVLYQKVSGAWVGVANLSTGDLANLNTVDSAQIAANAATAVSTITASAVAVTGEKGVPTGTFSTIVTTTFTPPVACEIQLTVEGSFYVSTAASGTLGDFAMLSTRFTVNGAQVGGLRNYAKNDRIGFSTSTNGMFARSQRFAATGGVEYTVVLQGQQYVVATTCTVDYCAMRVEQIKR